MLVNTNVGIWARKIYCIVSKTVFALEYNKFREEQRLNAGQSGLQNANNAAEEQQDFLSLLDNLALADFIYKDVIDPLIAS